jgi:predicted enzyme related to lactoylglutathione lyase
MAAKLAVGATRDRDCLPHPGAPAVLSRHRTLLAVMTATEGDVPPHWAVTFQVQDADATAARALELGGSLLMPPTDAPGFRREPARR